MCNNFKLKREQIILDNSTNDINEILDNLKPTKLNKNNMVISSENVQTKDDENEIANNIYRKVTITDESKIKRKMIKICNMWQLALIGRAVIFHQLMRSRKINLLPLCSYFSCFFS